MMDINLDGISRGKTIMEYNLQIHEIFGADPLDILPPLLRFLVQFLEVVLHFLDSLLDLVVVVGSVAAGFDRDREENQDDDDEEDHEDDLLKGKGFEGEGYGEADEEDDGDPHYFQEQVGQGPVFLVDGAVVGVEYPVDIFYRFYEVAVFEG